MSSVQISGNASGTGVLTVAAPNTNSSYTLTLPTQSGTVVSGTSASNVLVPAGTTAIAPVLLTSGTNLTSATAGAVEYDGKVVYATPIGTQRGVMPSQQYFRLDSALAGANVNTAQNIFGVGVTLSANTVYAFEAVISLTKSAGATSHSVGIGFGGTATLNNIGYTVLGTYSNGTTSIAYSTSTTGNYFYTTTASNTQLTAALANASTATAHRISGTVSINAGGTFIPQYTLSAAPGGAYSTVAGSFFLIYPVGASGANVSVGTWA